MCQYQDITQSSSYLLTLNKTLIQDGHIYRQSPVKSPDIKTLK